MGSKRTKIMPGESEKRDSRQSRLRTCDDEPTERHGRDDHNEEALGMVSEVRARKLNTDCEEARRKHHAHGFQGNALCLVAPRTRVEDIRAMRAHEHAEPSTQDNFIHV